MVRKYSSRASMVLYNILKGNHIEGTVLMPSNICESVPATYMKCGIRVKFCDINIDDWQIDRNCARKILSSGGITVLHYNHTYGYICEEDNRFLNEIKSSYPHVLLVDDRCLCFPEDEVCSPCDVVLYSTGAVKCVDIGWGGYCFIKDCLKYSDHELPYSKTDAEAFDAHIKKCHKENCIVDKKVMLSNWLNSDNRYKAYFENVSQKAEKAIKHKEILNSIYSDIPGSMDIAYCNWRYQLLLDNSKECIEELFRNGLYCSYHYKSLGNGYFSDIITPNNNWLEDHVINLFNDFRYTEEQARKTVEIIKKIGRPVR